MGTHGDLIRTSELGDLLRDKGVDLVSKPKAAVAIVAPDKDAAIQRWLNIDTKEGDAIGTDRGSEDAPITVERDRVLRTAGNLDNLPFGKPLNEN